MATTDLKAAKLLEQQLVNWQPDLIGTLIFVCQGPQVLLIHKKSGFGAGLINGPGGKLRGDETPAACAQRELEEELGVTVNHLWPVATLRFVETVTDQWLGYAFLAAGLEGVPRETPEARPVWWPRSRLPFDRMWPDDALWLPRVLSGECLAADFLFADSQLLASQINATGSWTSRWI